MSSVSNADSRCNPGDTLCEIRVYEQEVIVVPILLLASFLVTLVFILLLRFCPEKVDRIKPQPKKSAYRPRARRALHGIDAPPGINVLENESIALDIASSYSTFSPPNSYTGRNLSHAVDPHTLTLGTTGQKEKELYRPNYTPTVQPRELPRQRLPESFNLVTALPTTFSLRSETAVSLYRARMENRNVVLRVLNDSANANERHAFLGFASFLSHLGPHPFLPELLGVVSLRAPLVTVVEELENGDLLGFLWRCRQPENADLPSEMTERRIFTMGQQVASALEYLHGKDLLHGNIRARTVLVSREHTAKLWGLEGVHIRKNQQDNHKEEPGTKKWQAPELLAKRPASQSSDVWSFGLLLYEMVTLGEPPFAETPVKELLQFHQRGKTLRKPSNCSNTLYSLIKSCCQWKDQERISLADLSRKLQSSEKNASDKVLKGPGPIDLETYLQEAGYGEANNYTVF